jgi:Ca2+-binding RTX toxin-like protein
MLVIDIPQTKEVKNMAKPKTVIPQLLDETSISTNPYTGKLTSNGTIFIATLNAIYAPTGEAFIGTPGNDKINTEALTSNNVLFGLGGNDRLLSGIGNDVLVAGAGNDFVNAGDGSDLIFGDFNSNGDLDFGQEGNDTLNGGGGDDVFLGGAGNDILNGGTGDDNIAGQDGNDVINGDAGDDLLTGGLGNDTIRGGAGDDRGLAGSGDDLFYGGDGNDRLGGDTGNDTLYGGAGNDLLIGNVGNDLVSGGKGNDWIVGSNPYPPELGLGLPEIDTLTGGSGSDIFFLGEFTIGQNTKVFYDQLGNQDYALITDFNVKEDFIQLPESLQTIIGLGPTAAGLPKGTAIYANRNGVNDLIAIVAGVTPQQLGSSGRFVFGNPTPNSTPGTGIFTGSDASEGFIGTPGVQSITTNWVIRTTL